jgi:hypothetical protein
LARNLPALIAILIYPAACHAGFCSAKPAADFPRHEFRFSAGYSPQSSTLIGTSKDRRFVMAEFDYGYSCWTWDRVAIGLTPGIMPAAVLLQPAGFTAGHAVYGFAFTPIGFTVDLAQHFTAHPFFETNGGMIASTEPIPVNVPNATSVNFLFDFGGGLVWRLDQRHSVRFGYKFLHISNAGRTAVNPGVDNNVLYAGFSFLK